MLQGAAVHIFQFAAQRHAMRQAAGVHATRTRQLRQIMRRGLAFHGGIGGHDEFAHFAFLQALRKLIQAQLMWTNAIERAQPTLQHKIQAAKARGLLDCQPICRGFHHAQ